MIASNLRLESRKNKRAMENANILSLTEGKWDDYASWIN